MKNTSVLVSPVSPDELTNILITYYIPLHLYPLFSLTTDENMDKFRLTAVFISVQRKLQPTLLLAVF